MKHLAAAATAAALFAGLSGVAFAQTAAPAPVAPAPAVASPTQPSHAATVAPHATMMHRVARYSDQAGDPDTRALNLLEANGYTDITQFRQVGGDYQAMVTRDGKPMTVTVDPGTGQIQTRA